MKSTRVSISCPSDGSDFKTRSHWLAEALGAKWTRRRGYTVASANRAEQFRRLDAAGVDASRRYFASGRQP